MHNKPTPFTRTGVFASVVEDREIERLMEKAQKAEEKFKSLTFIQNDPRVIARALVQKVIDETAMSHGLPKIKGHYGYDIKNREFLTY